VFSDVDETIRELLIADMPIERNEVDVSFERPTREWSSRLSKPTLNLFLMDARELRDFRNEMPQVTRTEDGRVTQKRPARRIDLTYWVTAWAREAVDEHRILSRALSSMFRQYRVPQEYLKGQLEHADDALLLRMMPPDHITKPADFWGVMDNEMRPNLTWVATAPLDAFAPITGPLVRTSELRFQDLDRNWIENTIEVAGVVYRDGDTRNGVEGATVSVRGTTLRDTTDAIGRFRFQGMPAGERTWIVELPDGPAIERSLSVPGETYDIEI
jgi:hypothetical protein